MLKKEFLDQVAENAGLYKYQAYMFWKAFEEERWLACELYYECFKKMSTK